MSIRYYVSFITIIIWTLFVYFIGVLVKYLNYNLFEIHIFLTLITLYGFFTSFILTIFDENHVKEILLNLYHLERKSKILLFIAALPVNKLIIISYIDLDPIIIQLLNNTSIVTNVLFSIYYNKTYYLLDKLIILNMVVNVLSSIFPFIFNDNFSLKINNSTKMGGIGIINTIIAVILNSIINVYGANIKNIADTNKNCYTIAIFTFMIIELIIYLIMIPFMYLFQIYLVEKYTINFLKLLNIIIPGSIIGIFYGPFYAWSTKCYLYLSAIDIGIIRNISLIFTTIISCVLGLSAFYYLYIPAIFLIFTTSIMMIYFIDVITKKQIPLDKSIELEKE